MHIGSGSDVIDIIELERAQQDVRVCVEVTLGEFSGRYASVWLDGETLGDFVEQLAKLEQERVGTASLASLSPDEFSLTICPRDRLGHFLAHVSLCRQRYIDGTPWPVTVSGSVDLDPGALPSLLADFRSLWTPER